MSQRINQIYNFINSPLVYRIIQYIMSGTSFRNSIIKKNIRNSNLKILDIGCGPDQILEKIPKCDYYGYDIDQRSIHYSKNNTIKKTIIFIAKNLIKQK